MMQISRDRIYELVISQIKNFQEENETPFDLTEGEQTKLFGGGGALDSLGLVSLVVSIEEAIEEEFDIAIILADEKAMSRRTSPFGRISYLVDYIMEIINNE